MSFNFNLTQIPDALRGLLGGFSFGDLEAIQLPYLTLCLQ